MKTKMFLVLLVASILFPASVFAQSETVYQSIVVKSDVVDFETYSHSWEVATNQTACLDITFEGFPSRVIIGSGWFFGDDIWGQHNGQLVQINYHSDPGELAYQIESFEIDNPKELVICSKRTSPGSVEIGLRIKIVPEEKLKFKLYMPLIMLAPQTLYEERVIKEFEVIQVGFPNALPNQKTCVNFTWPSGTEHAYIESGWFIGDSLEINLNGNPIAYKILPKTGIAYDFEVNKDFSNPQGVLQICTTRSSGGTEIGLRAE